MLKYLVGLVVLIAVIFGGFFFLNNFIYQEKQAPQLPNPASVHCEEQGGELEIREEAGGQVGYCHLPDGRTCEEWAFFRDGVCMPPPVTDYKNATYIFSGVPITLQDGLAESEVAPGSASKTVTRYFGNEAKGDLNGDMVPDIAFLIAQETGGSGTFYYLVGAIQNPDNTYKGTHAVFLGDRIAPQTTEYHGFSGLPGGYIIVNYAERKPGEPMTATPSVGKSIWLKLDAETMQFGEIVQDFEGEAEPSKMSLGMKKWFWVSAQYKDGRQEYPRDPQEFILVFDEKAKTVSIGTDCNSGSSSYTGKDDRLSFGPIASTLMFCAESQETEFFQLLENTSGYHFTSRGELILQLELDSGIVTFR
ncbi:DUF333 domain-containing protein [Candidatus Parcubacteria bacterium]|nr:MAG: DUF333 domain-containing protein [Candidatus Parcubacteria bacterium]